MKTAKKEVEKLYFENEDSISCMGIENFLHDAKLEGLTEITVIEAIPDNGTSDYIWCQIYDCVQKDDCRKSVCSAYKSKSGRGKCENKGNLYLHGNKVTFSTTTNKETLK